MTGQDLLPLPGAVFSEATGTLRRVNGPFASNNSFGLIGLITLFFLVFLGRVLAHQLRVWRRVLHVSGVLSALAIAVMPMYRSIVVTLLVVIILELYYNKKITTRLAVIGLVMLGTVAIFWLGRMAPDLFESRVSDLSNLYGRIAQQRQTLELFVSHPVNGVGLGNYTEAALDVPDAAYRGVYSLGSAHNTLGAILVDTGLIGFVPFVFAQVYFFLAFWKFRKQSSPHTILATTFFFYVFLAYWMSGLVLTSGYYSDLNFWYLFVIAALYKFAVTTHAELYAVGPVDRHEVLHAVARAGVTNLR